MPREPEKATRDAWKTLPASEPFVSLPLEGFFSDAQFARIRHGLIPKEMEDKWFVYFDEPWLLLHRSWTGQLVYRVRFESTDGGMRVVLAEVIDARDRYSRSSDEFEARLLDFLIRRLLLGEPVPFPIEDANPSPPGAFQHHIAGTGGPEERVAPAGLRERFRGWLTRFFSARH